MRVGLLSSVLIRFLALFLPAAGLTGGVVVALYAQDQDKERTLHEQAGLHLAELHASILIRELNAVESDLLYLANQSALRGYLSGSEAEKRELQQEYQLFSRQRRVYDQIRYLDDSGRERIRVNYNDGRPAIVAEADLQPKAGRYYFARAIQLKRGEVFVSPFDLNVEHEEIERPLKPVIRFATPVFDRDGSKRGVLVLNYLGDALLRKLAEVSVSFPGSALLLNSAGHYLRGPSREDEWGFMLGHDRTFSGAYPEEWSRLRREQSGQFETAGGLFTFRTLTPGASVPAPPGDTEGGDSVLIIVSHVPAGVLAERPAVLLRRLLLLYAIVLVLLLALCTYLAYVGALRRGQERLIAESEARLRTLSAQLMTAQEEERRSISRDLHDELGQVVTAVTLDLQMAGRAPDPSKKDELIGRALAGAARMLDCIHEISARVRPTLLDDLGLKDAVQSYLSEYEQRTSITTRPDLHFEQTDVPAVVSENVYRILQEALTNVSRHAQAAEVFVELRVTAERVSLSVRDTGRGFQPESQERRGLGILGMRERAELLGGNFEVHSEPGKGTTVRVEIPLKNTNE